MNILEINSMNYGSTGNIMLGIAESVRKEGYCVIVAVPRSRSNARKKIKNQILIGNRIMRNIHLKLAAYTGLNDCFSFLSTIRFINKIDNMNVDIIHLHNLHNCYLNLGIFFRYVKKRKIRIIWTLHDCWSFTGKCTNFEMVNCEKWKYGCYKCVQHKEYPTTLIDRTAKLWNWKKKWFSEIDDLTIVTPSFWLAKLIEQSFMKDYNIKVIHNGIDLNIFKPSSSDFRKRINCEEKYILLGVAAVWNTRKGLDVFIELSRRLPDIYKIVLVGTDRKVDFRLPKEIISIHQTKDQKELADIYTAADLFINPTKEDNYPTVNMEAIACGTPVITYKTGGSPESINEYCGVVLQENTVNELIKVIFEIYDNNPFNKDECVKQAKRFDMNSCFREYIELLHKY